MNNDIEALRAHLFEVIAGVKDGSMQLDRARMVNEACKTLVDTAKVEVDFQRIDRLHRSRFLGAGGGVNGVNGITGVTRHLLSDD